MAGATLLLTEALSDEIANAVARGVPMHVACQAAGCSPSQIYEWLKAATRGTWHDGNPLSPQTQSRLTEFSAKIARARAEHQAAMIASIQHAATTVNPKTGTYDWRAADTILSKHPAYRSDWYEHRHVEQNVTVTHRQEHEQALEVYESLGLEGLDQLERMLPPPTTEGQG